MAIKRLVMPGVKPQEAPAPAPAPQPVQLPRVTGKQKPTSEQQGICESKADVVKVSAFAGTGKTWTLCAFSEVNPRKRILYIAFNKAIQLEASGKFPDHVTSRTAHSIAFGACGRNYAHKLAADIRPFHIQRHLELSLRDIPGPAHNLYGARVIETVKNYLVSGDIEMGRSHVSIGNAPVEVKNFDERTILEDGKRIWSEMQSTSSDIPMLHDGYLKLYQLNGARLPYDIILFDEAQDTNPVTQAIVEAQEARKVYVGDRHQAIYGFRGATNAMEMIDSDEHHYLTGSFRFGQAVADVANSILLVKNEDVRLQGYGRGSQVRRFLSPTEGYAYITRGNSAIFNRAVQCVTGNERFSFVGDIKGYRFDQILDVYNLSVGNQVKDAFIRSFSKAGELAEYAEAVNDREIISRCKLVAKYGPDIPRLIERIEQHALPPIIQGDADMSEEDTRIILTTGHKAKGLEFNNVKLAGDFMPLIDDEGNVFDVAKASPSDIEDVNIQYVAATRAMKNLQLCESLEQYLEYVDGHADRTARCP